MREMKTHRRMLAVAAAAAMLGACGGEGGSSSEEAPDEPERAASEAERTPEPAEVPSSAVVVGEVTTGEATTDEAITDEDDTASTHAPTPGSDSSADADSTIGEPALGFLLDSLLAEGVAPDSLLARASDAAHLARYAGDSLLADSFAARPRLPPGTQFHATSDWLVTAASDQPGDPVVATLVEDVAGPDGRVLVPQGAKFLGVVTEAQSALGPGEVPFLEVVFETLSAEAWERPIKTRVVAVAPMDRTEPPPGEIAEGALLVVELEERLVLPMPVANSVNDTLLVVPDTTPPVAGLGS